VNVILDENLKDVKHKLCFFLLLDISLLLGISGSKTYIWCI